MTSLGSVKIVFFDLDDTLCGYWEASKAALRQTFESHPIAGFSTGEMLDHWAAAFREFSPNLKQLGWYERYLKKGETTRTEQMRLMLLRMGVDDPALARTIGDVYADHRNFSLTLFPESLEVLETVGKQYPMGLITNGPADIQRQEIETLKIGAFFQHVYIEGEMGRGKPLPEVFHAIEDDVGFREQDVLFVGNSYRHDVQPALAVGWHAVWVRRDTDRAPSSSSEHPEDIPPGGAPPDAVISDLRQILPMLGGGG